MGTGKPWSPEVRAWLNERLHPSATPHRGIVIDLVVALTVIGWLGLLMNRSAARRLLAIAGAGLLGHLVARTVAPNFYLPQRYPAYALPPLVAVMVPLAVLGWFDLFKRPVGKTAKGVMAIYSLVLLLMIGGRRDPTAGLSIRIDPRQKIYAAIAKLPVNAKIAGWPRGTLDNVAYLTRRSTLVSFETHQAFHAKFVLEMRRRTDALIAAYFATSPEPLLRLRQKFGVTHLLVQLSHLRGRPPQYFTPFDRATRRAARALNGGRKSEVLRQLDRAAIFRSGSEVLLDLSRIDAAPSPKPSDRNP
jgi:hypothetical protein